MLRAFMARQPVSSQMLCTSRGRGFSVPRKNESAVMLHYLFNIIHIVSLMRRRQIHAAEAACEPGFMHNMRL